MKNEIIFIQHKTFANGIFQVLVPVDMPFVPQIGSTCNLSPQLIGLVENVQHFEEVSQQSTETYWESYVWLEDCNTFQFEVFSNDFLILNPEFKNAETICSADNSIWYLKAEGYIFQKNSL